MFRRGAAAVSIALVVAGCDRPADARPRPIRILAAASIADVCEAFVERMPDSHAFTVQSAASSTLARQVQRGAQADVFVSAHPEWIDLLESEGWVVPGSRSTLATTELVWIAPVGADLAENPLVFDGGLAIGDPAHVPAGRYAKSALEAWGLWSRFEDRVAPAPDVRMARRLVGSGQCSRGIVYRADVSSAAERVRELGPVEGADRVRYEMCLLYPSTHARDHAGEPLLKTQRLWSTLSDPRIAAELLSRFGFDPPTR